MFNSDTGTHHLAPGDLICFCSRPSAPPHCHTAALVNGAGHTPHYALPPKTQLSLEEVQEPPWTATFIQWRRYEDKDGVIFANRQDTVYDATSDIHKPTSYRQVQAGGRTCYRIVTIGQPRFG